MSVKSLVADPDFQKLSPEEKQGVLSSVDPEFKNIGVNEVDSVIQGIRGQDAKAETSSQPSFIGKSWDALAIPEKKAKEGLQMLAQLSAPKTEVTGNMTRDIAANLPRIGLETLSETAPSFISRGAILTAGALKGLKVAAPAIKAIGRGVARGAESISGLEYKTPGVLQEAATKFPSLETAKNLINKGGLKGGIRATFQEMPLFAPGKASAEYEAAKEVGGKVSSELLKIPEKSKFVEKALDLAEKGKLNATEALEARKELSSIKKSVTGEFFRKATEKLNDVAKPVFSEADAAYKQGIKSDALRLLLPVNKGGGTSIAKTAIGSLLGPFGVATMSPFVQAGAATGVGVAAKVASPLINNPVTTAAVSQVAKLVKTLTEDKAREYLKKAKNDPKEARKQAIKDGWTIPE